MNKKLLLASSIAVALGASAAANANHINIDTDTEIAFFASEIVIDPTNGTVLGDFSADLDLRTAIGVGIGNSTTRFFRWDLDDGNGDETDNPVYAENPTQSGFGCAASVTSTLVAGGGGEDFVIFEVATDASGECDQGNDVELDTDPSNNGDSLVIVNKDGVDAQFRHFETLTQATNEGTNLASESKRVVDWTPALLASFTPSGNVDQIDVTTENKSFTTGNLPSNQSFVGTWDIGIADPLTDRNDDGPFLADGEAISEVSDLIDGDTNVLVDGPNLNGEPGETLFAEGCGGISADLTAPASFDGDGNVILPVGSASGTNDFCLEVDELVAIAEGTFEAQYVPSFLTGFEAAQSYPFEPMDTLEKNGTSAEANFLLTPEGVFRNFVRITNPSPVDGRVFIRLINDAGDEVSVDLDEITVDNGGTPETLPAQLAAGASTPLININEVYAAAQAKVPTFEVVGGPKADKLRTIVDAEFGAPGALSGSGTISGSSFDFSGTEGRDTSVRIDVISVSNDNQAFFKFGN